MPYFKNALCGVVALVIAEFVPGHWSMFRGMYEGKATGLGAVIGGTVESLLSPLFWLCAGLIFAVFYAASSVKNKPLRWLLFWTPALLVASIGITIAALFAYAYFRSRPY
jgi:hypothetical protein